MESVIPAAVSGLEYPTISSQTPLPRLGAGVTLHAHQQEGLAWMLERWHLGKGVIVADEMGLGKTLQTLAFISSIMESEGVSGPFLVIAPLSVAPQWDSQCCRFTPNLRTFEYIGMADDREAMRRTLIEDHILKLPKSVRDSGDPQPLPFDLFITSYETCLADIDFLERFKWRVIIFDEGHRLKNPDGVTHRVFLEKLHARFKVILTGTPIQNNVVEFWALLRFLNPDIFTDDTRPESDSPPPSMDKLVHALVLRRLASASSLKLPAIDNLVIRTEMTKIQSDLYKWALFHFALSTRGDSAATTPAGVLSNLMMTLRKISSHPYLLPGVEPEPFKEGPHLWHNSNKLIVLRSLLLRMKAEGSRCLIFSNFTSLLDICQDFLDLENIPYERLDGSVRSDERTAAINRFSQDGADAFLLSTRAGGVGLNLTAADWVIFLDTDWNPQMDLQAIARAFRQGQTKKVKVFRLVTKGTVDELIFRRALEKLKFASSILGEGTPATASEMKNVVFQGISRLGVGNPSVEMPKALREAESAGILELINLDDLIECVDESEELVVSDYKQFDGIDYAEKHVSVPEPDAADMHAIDELMQSAAAVPRSALMPKPGVVPAVSETKQRAQQMTAEMRQKRKDDKWRQLGYVSRVIEAVSPENELDLLHQTQPGDVRHVVGSFMEPQLSDKKAVIVHLVDTSGIWPLNSRLFMSVSNKFPVVPKIYYLSKKAGDLRFGDVHLFSGPDLGITGEDDRICLALCVCHRDDDFELFGKCLSKLAGKFGNSVEYHFSRIGDRHGTFYIAERLIKRYVCSSGADAFIYHFMHAAVTEEPVAVKTEPVVVPKKVTLLDYFKSTASGKEPENEPLKRHPQGNRTTLWLSPEIPHSLRLLYAKLVQAEGVDTVDSFDRADIYVVSIKGGKAAIDQMTAELKSRGMTAIIEIPSFTEKRSDPAIITTEMLEHMLAKNRW